MHISGKLITTFILHLAPPDRYYYFNGTSTPTGDEQFVATQTKVLFNVTGTMEAPVKNLTIRGLLIRDTALTYVS